MSTNHRSQSWDPTSTESWADTLGLVNVPLFGSIRANKPPGNHVVLLDGQLASFTLSTESDDIIDEDDPLAWSWSANMRHSVFIDDRKGRLFVKRWETAKFRITFDKNCTQ
ncbi:MAG: hypothetical protein ABJA67_01855, partial [Chthonomonadales bacterium]